MLPAVALFFIFFLIPNLSSFFFAFTDWTTFSFYKFSFNGLDNFKRLIQEDAFKYAVINTLYFAIITTILKNVFGLVLALGISGKSRFNNFCRSVFFLPSTICTLVVGITFVAIYNPGHGILNVFLRAIGLAPLAQDWLVNTKLALSSICAMEIWQWTGYSMVIFIAGIKSVSNEFIEAARVDGANKFQTTTRITIPLMMQSLNISILLSVIGGMKVFAQVYATTNGGPIYATQVFGTFIYKTFSDGFLGYSSAAGMVMTIFTIVITLIVLPKLRKMEVEQ